VRGRSEIVTRRASATWLRKQLRITAPVAPAVERRGPNVDPTFQRTVTKCHFKKGHGLRAGNGDEVMVSAGLAPVLKSKPLDREQRLVHFSIEGQRQTNLTAIRVDETRAHTRIMPDRASSGGRIAADIARASAAPTATVAVVPSRHRFTVELYAPRSRAALDALASHLEGSGLKTSVELPDPAPASKLRYGILPFASLHLAHTNGKQPSEDAVMRAVDDAYADLRTRFGAAAVDLNGTLIGSISET
jgi:hypothetical protein